MLFIAFSLCCIYDIQYNIITLFAADVRQKFSSLNLEYE